MNLGKRLLQARKARGMTQTQVAELATEIGGLPLTQASYQKLEKRDSESSVYLFALAKALRVNPEWLQTGQGESGLERPVSVSERTPSEKTHKLKKLSEIPTRPRLDGRRAVENDKVLQFIRAVWMYANPEDRQLIEDTIQIVAGNIRSTAVGSGEGSVADRVPSPKPNSTQKHKADRLPTRRARG